jgi:hypothetical protein
MAKGGHYENARHSPSERLLSFPNSSAAVEHQEVVMRTNNHRIKSATGVAATLTALLGLCLFAQPTYAGDKDGHITISGEGGDGGELVITLTYTFAGQDLSPITCRVKVAKDASAAKVAKDIADTLKTEWATIIQDATVTNERKGGVDFYNINFSVQTGSTVKKVKTEATGDPKKTPSLDIGGGAGKSSYLLLPRDPFGPGLTDFSVHFADGNKLVSDFTLTFANGTDPTTILGSISDHLAADGISSTVQGDSLSFDTTSTEIFGIGGYPDSSLDNFSYDESLTTIPTPEPGTLILLGSGILGLGSFLGSCWRPRS